MDDVVSSIEHATLDAVPPAARRAIGPWLVGLDAGPVGRAHSAVPLSHSPEAADTACREAIESCFAHHGLPVVYRLPIVPTFVPFRSALEADGFTSSKPARVQRCEVASIVAPVPGATATRSVHVAARPDAAWSAVFLGEGFDPVEAGVRLGLLGRAKDALFASASLEGRVVAVGAACFSQGWCGIHGMRTSPGHRNRGLARSILLALVEQARLRGVGRAFLQVEAGNQPALALYGAAGFADAWGYAYWRRR